MIRNIIFDWSGTLVDDLPAVWRASNHVFGKAGIAHLTLDQFRAEFHLPFKGFYDRYTPHIPMPQLEEWFHSHFKEVQDSVRELPHARAFLELCRNRGVRTFVLSTIHRDHFAVQIAQTGFGDFIDRPYIEVLDKRTRILEILEENQLLPGETMFVGDMQHDIETARHGGIFSCAVLTGYHSLLQLRVSKPDLVVEHLGELAEILERQGWELTTGGTSPLHPVVTVGVLIFNRQGQVLMVRTRKWSNLWGIPGGKIKYAEPSEEALRRETLEETGLEIEDIRFEMVQDCIHSPEFYRDAHFILLNYLARVRGNDQVRLNDEAQEFTWVDPVEALALSLNRPTRVLLERVVPPNQRDSSPAAQINLHG